MKKHKRWFLPSIVVLKFNVDWAAREKSRPIGIEDVLCNHEDLSLLSFSSFIGVKDSNEGELKVI